MNESECRIFDKIKDAINERVSVINSTIPPKNYRVEWKPSELILSVAGSNVTYAVPSITRDMNWIDNHITVKCKKVEVSNSETLMQFHNLMWRGGWLFICKSSSLEDLQFTTGMCMNKFLTAGLKQFTTGMWMHPLLTAGPRQFVDYVNLVRFHNDSWLILEEGYHEVDPVQYLYTKYGLSI